MRLDARVAIVTGAAGGMGGGISRRFVREGATVVCLDKADPSERVAELEALRAAARKGSSPTCATWRHSSGSWTTSSHATGAWT